MKSVHTMGRPEALAVLRRANAITFSGATADGTPLARHFNAVLDGNALVFHGSRRGEKMGLVDRAVVATAYEVVATTPSYFQDERRACPATTYFRSVEARGTARRVEEPAEKARLLGLLMNRYQPEGGYVRIDAEHELYRAVVRSLLLVRVEIESVVGKHDLGQHKNEQAMCRTLTGLWTRGAPGDVEALEALRAAHPARPLPAFLRAPDPYELCVAPGEADVADAVALLCDTYWNLGKADDEIAGAQRGAAAWVGARGPKGRLVATARAVSDSRGYAYIGDVAVHPEHRGRGLGTRVIETLLAHPRVRRVRTLRLRTRDRQALYARFGFEELARVDGTSEMVLVRQPPAKP